MARPSSLSLPWSHSVYFSSNLWPSRCPFGHLFLKLKDSSAAPQFFGKRRLLQGTAGRSHRLQTCCSGGSTRRLRPSLGESIRRLSCLILRQGLAPRCVVCLSNIQQRGRYRRATRKIWRLILGSCCQSISFLLWHLGWTRIRLI